MNVLIDWGDGSPEHSYKSIERVELLERGAPIRTAGLPEAGVLYVNSQALRSIRIANDVESRGERLRQILLMRVQDTEEGESLEDVLNRILDERDGLAKRRIHVSVG